MLAVTPIGFETVVCLLKDLKLQKAGPNIRSGLTHSLLNFGEMRKRVVDTISTFLTSNKDVLAFPKDISLDSVFLLSRTATSFNLTLAVGYRDTSFLKPTGYVLCRNRMEVPLCHPRIAHYIVNVSRHPSRPGMFPPPRSFTDVVSAYLLQVSQAVGSSQTGFQRDVIECIFSFLEAIRHPNSFASYSDDFWCRLLLQCFDIRVVRCKKMKEVLSRLPSSQNTSRFRDHTSWKSATYSNSRLAYWWSHIKDDPLISQPLTDDLCTLRQCLTDMMPTTSKLNLCLNAFYPGPTSMLAPHQDKELRKWLGELEDVACAFAGAPRQLALGPNCQWRDKQRKRFPPFKVHCSSSNVVRIRPIANLLFVHAKLQSTNPAPSHTFTWRRGIPINSIKSYYPRIYRNLKM